MRDVLRNVDVTMLVRIFIFVLIGKSLYWDGLYEKGFRWDKLCIIFCSVLFFL